MIKHKQNGKTSGKAAKVVFGVDVAEKMKIFVLEATMVWPSPSSLGANGWIFKTVAQVLGYRKVRLARPGRARKRVLRLRSGGRLPIVFDGKGSSVLIISTLRNHKTVVGSKRNPRYIDI